MQEKQPAEPDVWVTPPSAVISACGLYRYELTRSWGDPHDRCCWIMLNPSTADAEVDDPTIRRCIAFSKAWGHGALTVVNLFALRSTDPEKLYDVADPIGPENDAAIRSAAGTSRRVVAAWGNHGALFHRGRIVRQMLSGAAEHLGLTKSGQPKHPLYLKADTLPVRW